MSFDVNDMDHQEFWEFITGLAKQSNLSLSYVSFEDLTPECVGYLEDWEGWYVSGLSATEVFELLEAFHDYTYADVSATFDSLEEIGMDYIESCDYGIDSDLEQYFDYEQLGYDLVSDNERYFECSSGMYVCMSI